MPAKIAAYVRRVTQSITPYRSEINKSCMDLDLGERLFISWNQMPAKIAAYERRVRQSKTKKGLSRQQQQQDCDESVHCWHINEQLVCTCFKSNILVLRVATNHQS
ncbi:hypothetical protein L1987_01099 [Smallanthus sonchifolius]|uniref:Uncharacterized protein n=1 Tax=Smallanthus sonchifolius TaxID=185202 RepID=A0ACB9K462_9ASTR|nr:hypothetical protein L1987_01099 [Smallanthus sonchifolius]